MLTILKHACSRTPSLVETADFDIPESHFFPNGDIKLLAMTMNILQY